MKPKHLGLIVTGMLFLAACSSRPGEAAPATEEAASQEPSSTEARGTDECLACHTDKQRLTAAAKAEVAVEAESKGVG